MTLTDAHFDASACFEHRFPPLAGTKIQLYRHHPALACVCELENSIVKDVNSFDRNSYMLMKTDAHLVSNNKCM